MHGACVLFIIIIIIIIRLFANKRQKFNMK